MNVYKPRSKLWKVLGRVWPTCLGEGPGINLCIIEILGADITFHILGHSLMLLSVLALGSHWGKSCPGIREKAPQLDTPISSNPPTCQFLSWLQFQAASVGKCNFLVFYKYRLPFSAFSGYLRSIDQSLFSRKFELFACWLMVLGLTEANSLLKMRLQIGKASFCHILLVKMIIIADWMGEERDPMF